MYDELAFEMQRTQRMRLGEQQSNSPVPFLDNCMSMCEARVAIASWPSTRKAKSAPVPLLCSLSTRSANVGHVTTAPCLCTVDSHPALMSFAQPPPFFIAHFYLERLSGQIWLRRQCGRVIAVGRHVKVL